MPAPVGVPLMVITSPDQLALTPVGKPFAAATPSSLIPVATVVECVIFVKAVFIHSVGLELDAPAVLSPVTVIVPVAFTLPPHPPVNGIV